MLVLLYVVGKSTVSLARDKTVGGDRISEVQAQKYTKSFVFEKTS